MNKNYFTNDDIYPSSSSAATSGTDFRIPEGDILSLCAKRHYAASTVRIEFVPDEDWKHEMEYVLRERAQLWRELADL